MKILIAGCSLSAPAPSCGFDISNQHQHWVSLLANDLNAEITNVAEGGASNQEIFLRTVEALTFEKFDLAIINWSSLSRLWLYQNCDFHDRPTRFLPREITYPTEENKGACKKLHNLYLKYFSNKYVETKHCLINSIALKDILDKHNTPTVFFLGFDLLINEFQSFNRIALDDVVDLKNRPDSEIDLKIKAINDLIEKTNQGQWLNLFSESYIDSQIDYADDGSHPGKESNKNLYKKLKGNIIIKDFYDKSI